MRRADAEFRQLTDGFDYFIPDGMPLIWCLNRQGAGLRDRVYGPTFMRRCLVATPAQRHYFLGGSRECLQRLKTRMLAIQPQLQIVGQRDGYFSADAEPEIVDEINRLSPDFIWIGLGTPKQQDWIFRNRFKISRGVLLAVGFAFDVNAGTKEDAPLFLPQLGLTWLFRVATDPRAPSPRHVGWPVPPARAARRAASARSCLAARHRGGASQAQSPAHRKADAGSGTRSAR